jgi:hypothetical protein
MFARGIFGLPPTGSSYQGHAGPSGREHLAGLRRGLMCLAILGVLLFLAGFSSFTVMSDQTNSNAIVTEFP